MLWLSKHARLRNNLSPYIDGRLTARETTALEAHLALCEGCRRELDELRGTALAMRQLPEAEAPRSFAITPGMLERRAAAVRPTPAIGAGMRLAGAAVAVALAVVLVGDLTFGDGNGSDQREAGSQPATESRMAVESGLARDAEKYAAEDQTQEGLAPLSSPAANAGAAAPCPPAVVPAPATNGAETGGAGGAAGGGVGGAGETPPATATPEPAPPQTSPPPNVQATPPAAAAMCGDASGGAAAPVTPQTPQFSPAGPGTAENAARAASAVNDDGGISTLRVAEIVLAAILVAILAGIVLEAALRRRRVA
jgi:hypothetical protein